MGHYADQYEAQERYEKRLVEEAQARAASLKRCESSSPGNVWFCSLEAGHSGEHRAYIGHRVDEPHLFCHAWPNAYAESHADGRPPVFPIDAKARKTYPIATGVLDYFPDAIAAIALVSYLGNEQHNPGEPLHWAREKSTDHEDTMMRHFMQRGTLDTDSSRHLAKAAWRILAMLQLEIEGERA